jgi:hypothetical protein
VTQSMKARMSARTRETDETDDGLVEEGSRVSCTRSWSTCYGRGWGQQFSDGENSREGQKRMWCLTRGRWRAWLVEEELQRMAPWRGSVLLFLAAKRMQRRGAESEQRDKEGRRAVAAGGSRCSRVTKRLQRVVFIDGEEQASDIPSLIGGYVEVLNGCRTGRRRRQQKEVGFSLVKS